VEAGADTHKGDRIVAGVRDPRRAGGALPAHAGVEMAAFAFGDPAGFDRALQGMDYVFLLRPSRITAEEAVFPPLIAAMRRCGTKGVLFLSVQGAEKSAFIPHHKIEALLAASGLEYVFAQPGYFMQNLMTTLLADIRNRRQGMEREMILVVILLHFLQRFQKEPPRTDWVRRLTGRPPTSLRQFAEKEKAILDAPA
jgi:putative NAD(P)-binding protein